MLRNAPLLWPLLAFGSGVAYPIPMGWKIGIVLLGGITLLLLFPRTPFRMLFATSLFFTCGCLRQPPLPEVQESADHYFIQFDEFPEETKKTWRVKANLLFSLDSTCQRKPRQGTILLYIDKQAEINLVPGYTYGVKGMLRPILPPERPTDFDFQTYMRHQGVTYQMWVPSGQIELFSEVATFSMKRWLLARARAVGKMYHKWIQPTSAADVTEAMITGRRDHLSEEVKDHYTAAGAVHILAVSGMHITLVYGLLTLLFRGQIWIWPKAWVKPKLILSVITLTLYAGFTGMTASVMRATVMFYLILLGQWFQRHVSSENLLYGTALILLFLEPTWLYDVGFQLSFIAVWGILTFYPKVRMGWQPENKLIFWAWDLTALGLSAQLVTFPLTLYYFHQFPTYFYVTNIVTAFLASALVPLGLSLWAVDGLPFPLVQTLFATLTGKCAEGLNYLNGEIAGLPYSVIGGFSMSKLEVGLWYVVFMLWMWGWRIIPAKWVLWMSILYIYSWMGWKVWQDFIRQDRVNYQCWEVANQRLAMKIQGKYAVVVSILPLKESTKTYVLKNYMASQGIQEVLYLNIAQ